MANSFPPIVQEILSVNPRAYSELSPTSGPTPEARKLLECVSVDDLFDAPIVSYAAAYAVLAGLWLWNDGLNEAHHIVQQEPEELLAALNLHGKGKKSSQNMDSVQSVEICKDNGPQHLREMTATFAYWHGIMHRREPDYGNAKYWFRRVGRHPIFDALWSAAQAQAVPTPGPEAQGLLTWGGWDPYRFVDLCQLAAADKGPFQLMCRRIAVNEWELLFDHSYRQAIGQA